MATQSLTQNSVALMHYLMQDATIASKVKSTGKPKKPYAIYTINSDGTVVLGETRYRWWNQLIKCQFTLTFEMFATCVWDALVDLSTGENQEALLQGLSKEILEKAQREKKYDWVVERLVDCFRHVCNSKDDTEPRLEGRPGKSGRKEGASPLVIRDSDGKPVVVNVNLGNTTRAFRFPDATGNANLVVDLGVVGVHCEHN